MRLRFLGEHYAAAGRGAAGHPWSTGEVRELSESEGRYLLDAFPRWFVAESVATVVESPPFDRAMRSGRKLGGVR